VVLCYNSSCYLQGTHYVGFVYDTDQDIELSSSTQMSQLLFTGSFTVCIGLCLLFSTLLSFLIAFAQL